jgi:hypothetical protein
MCCVFVWLKHLPRKPPEARFSAETQLSNIVYNELHVWGVAQMACDPWADMMKMMGNGIFLLNFS